MDVEASEFSLDTLEIHPRCSVRGSACPDASFAASAHESLSLHGLRAGFITDAYRAGARDVQITNRSRHKDARTMCGYIRRAKLMEDDPADLPGLSSGDCADSFRR